MIAVGQTIELDDTVAASASDDERQVYRNLHHVEELYLLGPADLKAHFQALAATGHFRCTSAGDFPRFVPPPPPTTPAVA